MTKQDPKVQRDVGVMEAVVTNSAATLATTTVGPVGGLITSGVAPVLGALLRRAASEHVERRTKLFEDEVVRAMAEGGIADDVLAGATDEHRDLILQMFHRAMTATDPTAVPFLARLTGQHLRSGQRPDSVFRGIGRLLQELVGDEFAALKELIEAAGKAPSDKELVYFSVRADPPEPARISAVWLKDGEKEREGVAEVHATTAEFVLRRLQNEGLVYLYRGISHSSVPGNENATIKRETLDRLREVVG